MGKHLTPMLGSKHFQGRPMELACNLPSNSNKNIHSLETSAIFINTKMQNNFSIPAKATISMFTNAWKKEILTNYLSDWWEIHWLSIEKKGDSHNSWIKMDGCPLWYPSWDSKEQKMHEIYQTEIIEIK